MSFCFSLLRHIQNRLGRQGAIAWLALAAFVLTLPSLVCGLAGDDYFNRAVALKTVDVGCIPRSPLDIFSFVFSRGTPQCIQQGISQGIYPWWTHPQLQLAFFRPLASLTHLFDFRLLGNSFWLMHVHSLAWYVLLVLVTGLLYKRLLAPAWVAGLAALLYALDYSHAVGAASLCNRNAVMAAIFCFLSLMAHDRWRRDGSRLFMLLAPGCFLLGLLSAEAALAMAGYLLSYTLFLDRGRPLARWAALLPCAFTAALWRVIYNGLGYGAAHSGVYIDPGRDIMRFAAELGSRLPVLLQGQLLLPTSDLWSVLPSVLAQIYAACAAACIIFTGWAVWPLLRRDSTACFFAVGMAVAAIPFCSTLPSNRFLFFTGLGGMGLIARFLASGLEPPAWFVPHWRGPRKILASALIVIWLVISPLLLAVGTLSPLAVQKPLTLAAQTIAAPESGPPAGQIVVVNVPSDLMLFYLPFIRAASGQSASLHPFLLSAGVMPVEVQRVNDRTLMVRLRDGLLAGPWEQVFRDAATPVEKGFALQLAACSVAVTGVTDTGLASEIRYEFRVPLEDRSLRWVTWSELGFVPFALPAPGQTVRVKPLSLF